MRAPLDETHVSRAPADPADAVTVEAHRHAALHQLPDRRGAGRHAIGKTPVVERRQFLGGENDLKALMSIHVRLASGSALPFWPSNAPGKKMHPLRNVSFCSRRQPLHE